MKTRSIVLVLAGAVFGCGAGATVAASYAGPEAGKWTCAALSKPDLAAAVEQPFAKKMEGFLNQLAPGAPVGATVTQEYVLCAKN